METQTSLPFENAKQTGLTFMMAATSCRHQRTISVRKLHQEGAIGRMICCESDYFHPGLRLFYGTSEIPTSRYALAPLFYLSQTSTNNISRVGSCDTP